MILGGISQIYILQAAIPFISILKEPNKQPDLKFFDGIINISDSTNYLFITALIFIITCALSSFIRILGIWINVRLAAQIGTEISSRIFQTTLYKEFDELNKKTTSSEMSNAMTEQVMCTVQSIDSFFNLLT